MILKGKLIKCNRTAKVFKGNTGKEKLYITLAEVDLTKEQKAEIENAFKDSGKKFTPTWVQEFEGFVNLSTSYELPYKDMVNKEEGESIEEYIEGSEFKWCGASVRVSVNIKEGAIYPKALVIDEEGEEYNPFADFEE